MELPFAFKHHLANQSVIVGKEAVQPLSGFPEIIEELKAWSGTETDGVAISYFFRQYALFITAQFDAIATSGLYFSGTWKDLQFSRIRKYGYPLLETHTDPALFVPVTQSDRFKAFHHILSEQTDAFIQEFRKHAKISPVILWENVLGSVLWFYANLEQRDPRRAAEDIEWLMDSGNWAPVRKSYLAAMVGNATLQQAVTQPLRRTCCLYKELPDFDTCTFCPVAT
ncbi:hypothetical protein [Planococcus lenghuensis]|uniref:Ferric iron reductase protein FhuF n=1 Tax=Planococcus lenghuensis TaxID=2213202 RepID=A0A1Q2L1S5_9BACL|nr:hypothetical protein [Planococcus lenghuensis]AQQ54410.1 hypothetical protein B0X71_15745 [Planococcus lenghuensis]